MKLLPNNLAVIEGDTHISKWVEESGKLAHDEYSLGIILPNINEGDFVVDAGAFIGDHTIAYLEKVGASGAVYAFEPNPKAFECLVHNCPKAVSMPYGLSDKRGEYVYSKSSNAGAGHLGGAGIEKVVVLDLDSINLKKLNFFKLDVEGHEISALRGARQTIEAYRPMLWVECNSNALYRQGESLEGLLEYISDELKYDMEPHPEPNRFQYDILCRPR